LNAHTGAHPSSEQQPERPIRIAGAEDRPCLIDLCCWLHAESGAHRLSLPKIARLIDRGLARDRSIMPVIGEPGDIRAMMLLIVDEVYYSDEFWLAELWNYVRPDSRRSAYGRQLLRFAMECADRSGLDLVVNVVSDARLDAKLRMYERCLGAAGAVFIYRPGANKP
jgi:GNAT superfamily N-acetyltransferase